MRRSLHGNKGANMKNKKFIVLILTLTVILTCSCLIACSEEPLATPNNLAVSNELVITWDAVEGASAYMISFNGDIANRFMTKQTSCNLKSTDMSVTAGLKSGEKNTVQIQAVFIGSTGGPTNGSKWSNAVEFNYSKQLDVLKNFKYDADDAKITWRKSSIDNVTYKLVIKEKNTTNENIVTLDGSKISISNVSGNASLVIADMLATLDNKVYEVAIFASATGFEDSDYSSFVEIDLTSGAPDIPDEPDTPDEPDIPIELGNLENITAIYVGGDMLIGSTEFNSTDIMVKATYSSGNTKTVYDFTTDIETQSTVGGEKTITITYEEGEIIKTATVLVNFVATLPDDPANPDDQPNVQQNNGYVILGIDDNWEVSSGKKMTLNVSNGIEYMYKGLEIEGGNDAFKIFYDGNFYGYENVKAGVTTSVTADSNGNIVLEDGEYDIYFDFTVMDNKQIWIHKVEQADPNFNVTIYFKNTANWDNVCAYSWISGGATTTAAWPGTTMTAVDGQDGWYSIEINGSRNIIFNNGSDSAKTVDLVIEDDKYYFVYGVGWATGFNDEPEVLPTSNCYLRGEDGTAWNDWGNGKMMEYNESNDEYSITVTLGAGAEIKVYYVPNNAWLGTESIKAGVGIAYESPAGGNIKITNAGTYTIYYKASGGDAGIWIELATE